MNTKQDYDSIQWIVYLFLSGAVYTVALNSFIQWSFYAIINLNTALFWSLFVFFGALLFSIPIFLCFILTRIHPTKRLIPPLLIQIISFSILLIFYRNFDFMTFYFVGLYTLLGGVFQDSLVTYFVGIKVNAKDFMKFSYELDYPVTKLKEVFNTYQVQNMLKFRRRIKTKDGTFKLRTARTSKWQEFLEITQSERIDHSIINIVSCNERRYDIQPLEDEDSIDEILTDKASMKDYLKRKFSINFIDLPTNNADSLLLYALDYYQGSAKQVSDMPLRRKLGITLGISLFGISIGLLIFNKIDWGLGTLAIAVASLVDGLRD